MRNITVKEAEDGTIPRPAPHHFRDVREYVQYLMDVYQLSQSFFIENKKRLPKKEELAEIESELIYHRYRIKVAYLAQKLKPILLRMQGSWCWYCRKSFPSNRLTVEHWIPVRKHGPTKISNCLLACKPCNSAGLTWYIDVNKKGKEIIRIKEEKRRHLARVKLKRDGTFATVEYNRFSRAILSKLAEEGDLTYVVIKPPPKKIKEKVARNMRKPAWIKEERKKRWHYVSIPSWVKNRKGRRRKYILI